MSADCIFCKIIAGAIPSTRLYEDDLVVAFNDIAPVAPVHVLLVPRQHVASVAEMGEADEQVLTRLFAVARKLAKEKGIADSGFRIVTNTGPDSGQVVFHLHFHLIGGRTLGRIG